MSPSARGASGECYLDAATAAPQHPVAREALLAALADGWADPGRVHAAGRRAHQLLEAARAATAAVLGAQPDEVTFCASGTEAALQAVRGTLAAAQRPGTPGRPIIVHSAVEHSAVLAAVAEAAGTQRAGHAIAVGVDRVGRIDLDAFAAAVRTRGVTLAALISASHEVGTTQPVAAAAGLCTEAGVPLYVDAAQSFGRVPVPAGWSLLTGSARKWGGPAGVGVLVVRRGTRWLPQGGQLGRTAGLAAGEERLSLPAVVAAAAALRAAAAEATAEAARQYGLVDKIRRTLVATVPDVEVVGDPVERLPHLVTFSCLYIEGEALSRELDRRGFAVSSGSACTTASGQPSHVLAAMGVLTQGNVRVSLHPGVTAADIDRFLAAVPEVVAQLRAEAGVLDLVSEL